MQGRDTLQIAWTSSGPATCLVVIRVDRLSHGISDLQDIVRTVKGQRQTQAPRPAIHPVGPATAQELRS